jgi:hypothetical protein
LKIKSKVSLKLSSTYKTISAEEAAYDGFRQLAKEYKLTNPELLAAMVQYFRVTKADPRAPNGPDLTSALAKLTAKLDGLDKRAIGFIREQEKQYLKPILAEVQAHRVLNAPTVRAPAGLSDDQVQDLTKWFIRVLARGMQPTQLTPAFLAMAPQANAGGGQKDPSLDQFKATIIGVIQRAFRPELMVPAMHPKPPVSNPAVSSSAAPPPATGPVSSPTQPA